MKTIQKLSARTITSAEEFIERLDSEKNRQIPSIFNFVSLKRSFFKRGFTQSRRDFNQILSIFEILYW